MPSNPRSREPTRSHEHRTPSCSYGPRLKKRAATHGRELFRKSLPRGLSARLLPTPKTARKHETCFNDCCTAYMTFYPNSSGSHLLPASSSHQQASLLVLEDLFCNFQFFVSRRVGWAASPEEEWGGFAAMVGDVLRKCRQCNVMYRNVTWGKIVYWNVRTYECTEGVVHTCMDASINVSASVSSYLCTYLSIYVCM